MFHDASGKQLAKASTRWIEPPWKAILPTRGFCRCCGRCSGIHPGLLPAYFEDDPNAARLGNSFVRKPLYLREGANVALVRSGTTLVEQEGLTARKVLSGSGQCRCRTFRMLMP